MRVAHVSTFPPTQCGIAVFAQDLIDNLSGIDSLRFRLFYGQDYSDGFEGHVNHSSREQFEELGAIINASAVDVVDLQHEFGIWGGAEGEHLIPFLRRCEKPIVSTVHTPRGRTRTQNEMLKLLCERSARIVVLTEQSRTRIGSLVPSCQDKVSVIRHGVPNILFVPAKDQRKDVIRFISPGFFRPDKGLEDILDAFCALKDSGLPFEYHIVGNPQQQFEGQIQYHDHIQRLIRNRALEDRIEIRIGFWDRADLIRQIQSAECGVIGYTDLSHSSSGIVPLILACGRPVVSTPFEYSRETATRTSGLFLTSGVNAQAFYESIKSVIANWESMKAIMPLIHRGAEEWIWPSVARQYLRVLKAASVGDLAVLEE